MPECYSIHRSGSPVSVTMPVLDRQRLIKGVAIKWQALHRTAPQVNTTALDSGCVPSTSLLDHLLRLINARDIPRCGQLRQALNHHSRSETHFQHAVIWSDLEEVADPRAAIS